MRRHFLYVTLLAMISIAALPISAQSRKDRDDAKKLQEAADKAIAAKNYKEAAELYGKSVALVPKNSYAHYRKGYCHYSLKEYDEAVDSFTLALDQGFAPLDIYRIRHYIYFDQGKYDAALEDVQKGLALAPKDVSLINAVGEINYARKVYPEALNAFQEAAKLSPDGGDIHYNLARVYFAMHDAKGQAESAETALSKGTRFPSECWYLLGDGNQKLKKSAEAIDAYQKALGLKPNMYQVYQNLSEIFKSESRFGEAIDTLKKGLIQFPLDGKFYTELGLLYSLDGRFQDAVAAAKAGVQILPNQASGYTNLCRAYNETKDYTLAISACNSSLRIRPDDGETYFYLGNAYALMGRGADATKAYSNAVKGLVEATSKDPEQSEIWYLLGNAYFADKQYDKAIESYLKCLDISPKFLKARANLGISYTRKRNKAAATEQYNLLLATDQALAARVKAEIDRM